MMAQDTEILINALRIWGRVGFWFFAAMGVIVGIVIGAGGNLSFRAVLIVSAFFALGFVALSLAGIYEWIALRVFSGNR